VCTKACAESAATKNSLRARDSDIGASRPIYRLCNSECIADVKPPVHVSHTPAHRIVPASCVPNGAARRDAALRERERDAVDNVACSSRPRVQLDGLISHAGSENRALPASPASDARPNANARRFTPRTRDRSGLLARDRSLGDGFERAEGKPSELYFGYRDAYDLMKRCGNDTREIALPIGRSITDTA